MTTGFALGALAAALVGAVQAVLAVRSIHVAWIVSQYVALSASKVLLAVTAYNVAYSQAPAHTRATAVSVWLATVALGRGLTALIDLLPLPDVVLSFTWATFTLLIALAFPPLACWALGDIGGGDDDCEAALAPAPPRRVQPG
eukprot:m51a1_g3712 putative amino acid peptide transporter (143) ;mRNA; f:447145-447573